MWLRSTAPLRFPVIWLSLNLSAGVDRLLLLLLLSLVLVYLLLLVASRLGSGPLPLLALVAASASGVERGGLLLLGLRVSGGRSHHLSGPFPAVVCPSTGRPGGTGVRSLGW